MNIFRLFFELFLIYLAYKLVFEFIIPVYKTTKQVREKMNVMQEQMRQQGRSQPNNNFQKTEPAREKPRPAREDYIDYEEV